ncbi:hypothetical protein VdG2_06969 [Verticillium dahliae VDG2]|nr:hypothetical protein VdG2_06969 [Verticillium dahliae VDG2]
MESDGGELTQPNISPLTAAATQNVLDPRRVGKQNSGFSDDDISDIICLLYPYSPFARQEVLRIAQHDATHILGREQAAAIEPDYDQEHQADNFQLAPPNTGDYALILRLSTLVKDPLQGFQFGRNASRCDVCFSNDPMKRLSNVHFRIYVNKYGVVMLEDQSTNGTFVDSNLLRGKNPNDKMDVRRTLSHGSKIKILMHSEQQDLEFLVRIPKREGEYDRAWIRNLEDYFERIDDLQKEAAETVVPTPGGGHPDLFSSPKNRPPPAQPPKRIPLPSGTTQENVDRFPREWRGSNKYNKVGQIGKGAFAIVHKVTSKFDGKPYAAKELEKRRFMKNGVLDQKVENEMRIMQKNNVVRYIEHFDWENRLLIIIMEFVPGGDLGRLVAERGILPEVLVQRMATQLLSAMDYLHENNITHRDVKPDNILVQSIDPFEVKLTDFGLSKMVDNEQTFLRTFCGTLLYCAPEVYSEYLEYDDHGFRQPRGKSRRAPPGQRYDHAIDIWSLGGVLFYALTGKPPYPVRNGISYSELLHQIMTTNLNTEPLVEAGVSDDAIGFLGSMLQRRPEHRATVHDLQGDPWLGGQKRPEDAESLDEVTDDDESDLQVGASQLSIQEGQSRRLPHEPQFEEVIDDVLDDFLAEDSEKENEDENGTFGRPGAGPKLFGEVNVSAVGSSGVIPEGRLNISLPGSSHNAPEDSMETEILDSQGSHEASTIGGHSNNGARLSLSRTNGQSNDQLHSLVENVRSQSLGASESVILDTTMKTANDSGVNDSYWTASKRKPAYDTSDEFEESRPGKPVVKRLRSEGNIEALADQAMEEFTLLASVPLVERLKSGRQIDGPQDKTFFWEGQNMGTWHLDYPEMTELQRQVFTQAAESRKEVFAPGKSGLWDLAMKYFPPHQGGLGDTEQPVLLNPDDRPRTLQRDVRTMAELREASAPPPTAPPPEEDDLPDTLPPETQRIVPIIDDEVPQRALAVLESSPGSVVSGISVPVRNTFVSWGRGPENTAVYTPKTELRVPKYAVKILLWTEELEPTRRHASKTVHPWDRQDVDPTKYGFYLSTKATIGIHVNGCHLPSPRPGSSSLHWIQLHDGDEIVVWGTMDNPEKTKLIFRCFWSASSQPRTTPGPPRIISSSTARRLEEASSKAERRARTDAERQRRLGDADRDFAERKARIDRERERTMIFERRVLEARDMLIAVKAGASRRDSPASAPATTIARGLTPLGAPSPRLGRATPEV